MRRAAPFKNGFLVVAAAIALLLALVTTAAAHLLLLLQHLLLRNRIPDVRASTPTCSWDPTAKVALL